MPNNNWGRWGDADERGTLNLLTPEVVKAALATPKTGKVYPLSIPIQRSGIPIFEHRGAPQRLTMSGQNDEEHLHKAFGGVSGVGANEDVLIMAAHTATHLDALGHVYEDRKMYNGFSADDVSTSQGAPHCGIDRIGAIAARGILVDIAAVRGVDALEPGYTISPEDFDNALASEGVSVRPGDAVLIRTGWLESFLDGTDGAIYPQPGIGLELAEYLASLDVSLVGSDNSAVEVMPFDRGVYLGSHIVLLVRHGICLLEHVLLDDMARDKCYEFLLNIGPLNVTGGTGSPVTPIAIG